MSSASSENTSLKSWESLGRSQSITLLACCSAQVQPRSSHQGFHLMRGNPLGHPPDGGPCLYGPASQLQSLAECPRAMDREQGFQKIFRRGVPLHSQAGHLVRGCPHLPEGFQHICWFPWGFEGVHTENCGRGRNPKGPAHRAAPSDFIRSNIPGSLASNIRVSSSQCSTRGAQAGKR